MTEIDVDMAIHAMTQAVEDLLAAARDKNGRQHVAANRQRLVDEVGRLYDSLNVPREPAATRPALRTAPNSGAGRRVVSGGTPQRRVA